MAIAATNATDLVIIFGPPAVGKMTVGQELAKLTGFRLFHNHMTIDMLTKIFPFNSAPFNKLCIEFRRRIIEEAATYSELNGIIFTYVWALDAETDRATIEEYKKIIENQGGRVFFVELQASLSERLFRNKTENRLAHKNKSKTEKTEETIINLDERFRMNTSDDFFYASQHIKIDNTDLSPEEVALKVVKAFNLKDRLPI